MLQRLSRHAGRRIILQSRLRHFSSVRFPSATKVRPSLVGAVIGSICLGSGAFLLLQLTTHDEPIRLEASKPGVTVAELQKHTSPEQGVWVLINGQVYDLTDFLAKHPGGAKIILTYAGKNALAIFNKFHAKNFIEKYLTPANCLGPLIGELEEAADITEVGDDGEREFYRENLPPLSEIMSLTDFEYIASKILSPSAWYYYSSGSCDEVTLRENHNAFSRIFFKPRVLVDMNDVDLSTTMLGEKTDVPFYVSAAAQAKLGHPDGELSIARGCGEEGVIQMISHFASYSLKEIVEAAKDGQKQWSQLYYVTKEAAKEAVEQANELGIKAIFLTVDTPELGRREKDMKLRARLEAKMAAQDDQQSSLSSNVIYGRDLYVTWDRLKEVQLWTDSTLVIKGVQCVDDIVLAAENGIKAVVLSNHGGRQLDYSRAPIEVLADAMPVLKEKGLDDKIEIYIDGGIRRGSDVIKCLALGAKGVGLGRVFLYANACYGEAGVRKAIQMLREEVRLDMRLIGVSKIEDLGPQHLDLRNLYSRTPPRDNLYYGNYEPLTPPSFAHE